MNFSKTGLAAVLVLAVIVAGCTNEDKSDKAIYDQLYFDYTITAEEDGGNVTSVFQYKEGDAEGKAVNIAPAKVELDGMPVQSDSARLSGFFYEVQRPVDSFAGKHSIVVITSKKQYENQFEFFPFTLQEEIGEKIHRRPFTLQLKNFPPTERSVRLLLLDTAFESRGFNDLIPVVNGKVTIDQFILKNIKNGPINLELYLEQEIPLKQTPRAGGKISITYGLKREFELVD